jgi:4'-phosphopantetheinyl transferase
VSVTWHRADAREVPAGDEWLTTSERVVLAGLAVAKRRADWRLGRWTAKSLFVAALGVPVQRVEVRAAADGAPDAFVDGAALGWSLSLSHRDGVAVAAIAPGPTRVGIDLETLETRSDAFVREWLSADEQATLASDGPARDRQVLCCWTGKEASAKVLREGLRLDVRQAAVTAGPASATWSPLDVRWRAEGITHHGWWKHENGTVIAVVTDPPTDPPARIRDVVDRSFPPRAGTGGGDKEAVPVG